MKLKPRQIIGLVAIVVFGGIMIVRFTQPSERQIMEQRLASLPTFSAPEFKMPPIEIAPAPDLPLLELSTTDTGAPTATPDGDTFDPGSQDYLNVGSQAAKDDMYCSGVLSAEFEAVKNTAHPDLMSILLRDHMALDTAGLAKLKAEKLLGDTSGAAFSLAYDKKTAADYEAKALRIPVETCSQRAAALN